MLYAFLSKAAGPSDLHELGWFIDIWISVEVYFAWKSNLLENPLSIAGVAVAIARSPYSGSRQV